MLRDGHFRPEIEGLRAVAILAVLGFHVGLPGFGGGFVGVDVFFVISGFLITGMLAREVRETGRVSLAGFYARRLRRLLPAALVVIIATAAISLVVLSSLHTESVMLDGASAALYVSNFRFAMDATDYFGSALIESPYLHYWSLSVEEQFYLVWPLMVAVVARRSPRALPWVIVVIGLVSFALSLAVTASDATLGFYMLHTRAWQLALGALAALGVVSFGRWGGTRVPEIAAWVGLLLIAVAVIGLDGAMSYPGAVALLPTVGAVMVVAGARSHRANPGRWLAMAAPRYIGRISYSLYLWHWPLLILVPIALRTNELWVRVALAGLAILVAAVSTRVIEDPFRRGFLPFAPRRVVLVGIAASIALALALVPVAGSRVLNPVDASILAARDEVHPSLSDGCHVDLPDDPALPGCVYGSTDGTASIALFGDSHAQQWLPAIEAAAQSHGWRVTLYSKNLCPPYPLVAINRLLKRVVPGCAQWRASAEKEIVKNAPDVVIVSGSRGYSVVTDDGVGEWDDPEVAWADAMVGTLQRLAATGSRVALVSETPRFDAEPLNCLASGINCVTQRSRVVDTSYADLEARVATEAGAHLVDVTDWLCTSADCPLSLEGEPVYRDQTHVATRFAGSLSDAFGEELAMLISQGRKDGQEDATPATADGASRRWNATSPPSHISPS